MKNSKSNLLPMIGILIMWVFIGISYTSGSLFLDKLAICGFILTVIGIAKMKENTHQSNRSNDINS